MFFVTYRACRSVTAKELRLPIGAIRRNVERLVISNLVGVDICNRLGVHTHVGLGLAAAKQNARGRFVNRPYK